MDDTSRLSAAESFTKCPACRRNLPVADGLAYCGNCELYLASIPAHGRRVAAYALSLPERLSRIAVGSVAGILKGASEMLLPEAVRTTKLYHVLLSKNLRYLIQNVGAVDDVFPQDAPAASNYIARKFVGNFIELTGILTLRASPVWILALVSDLSGGTRVFLEEFVQELKAKGLLDADSGFETVDQLLDGLQSFSARMADQIDTPPLSVEELRETVKFLREDAQGLRLKGMVGQEELDSLLQEMKEVAVQEKRSLYEISAAMAMEAINQLQRSGRSAATGLRVGRALLDRTIFKYYTRALHEIAEEGYYRYLVRSSRPYLKAIRRHLTWKNISWTERYFLRHTWSRIPAGPDAPGLPAPGAAGNNRPRL